MHFFVLATSLVFSMAERPLPPKPPGEKIVVQDREILIPLVPASAKQAHAEYGKVVPRIREGIQDLERELEGLLASDLCREAVPASIRVQSDEAEAAAFFLKILNDDQYAKLQKTAAGAWNEWQSVLMETGLAKKGTPVLPKEGSPRDDNAELKKKLRIQKLMAWNSLEHERKLSEKQAFNAESYLFYMEGVARHEEGVARSMMVMTVADKKAPQLAQAWNPLVDYLNACALRMADLDSPSNPYLSEGLLRIRLQAKITFLKRCRTTLWFCHRVWARMTSSDDPAPLKDLH